MELYRQEQKARPTARRNAEELCVVRKEIRGVARIRKLLPTRKKDKLKDL